MATFAKKTFDAAAYLKYRSSYPQSLIQHVIDYARPPSGGVALDLGCGPGQATTLLAASGAFRKVTGVDPSHGMIDAAISTLKRDPSALVDGSLNQDALAETEYRVGSAEKLDWIPDASVDLVTAAQAAHWFKHGDVYAELQRILKPGGTVAYIGYGYMHFPKYPSATPKIHNFGLKKLGPYWEPGRNGPDSLYDLVPFPTLDAQGWDRSSFIRNKFDQSSSEAYIELNGDNPAPPETKHFPIAMKKTLDFEGIRRSLYTWSSVHTYMEKHKPATHVVDEFMDSLKEELPVNVAIDVAWPTGLLLMKKQV